MTGGEQENRPLVSVIIPALDAEPWIHVALSSVIGQTWDRLEVIVVDDGSRDGTRDVVTGMSDPRVRLVTQEHRGASAARNRGFAECSGELIQFLDADDVLGSEKIALQVTALRDAPDGSVASCAWASFSSGIDDATTTPEPVWEVSDPVEWLARSLGGEGMMQPGCWLVPRPVVEAAGPWDETLTLHDDGEYFARVLTRAARNVFVPQAMVYYRAVPGSLSRRRGRAAAESALAVCRSRHATLSAARDDDFTRRAIATQYAQFAYEFGPASRDLASAALAEMSALGVEPLSSVGGGSFKRAARLLGADAAIRLRSRLTRG